MLNKIFFQIFIFLLSIEIIFTLGCYECENCTSVDCECSTIYVTNSTDSFCLLTRETITHGDRYEIRHAPAEFFLFGIADSDFISVVETIIYNDTQQQWLTISNQISYGCFDDLCNQVSLLKQLPSNGLSLMLPTDWLNSTLQRQNPDDLALCRICNDGETVCASSRDALNRTACPRSDCSGTCLVDETLTRGSTIEYCYSSYCSISPQINDQTRYQSEVVVTAVYFLKKNTFEIYDQGIMCNGDRCDSYSLFSDVESKLTFNLENIRSFLSNHVQSIYSMSISYLIAIVFIQMSIHYY